MNKIWYYIVTISILMLIFSKPESIISEMMTASSNTVTNCLQLFSIYAVWLGLMEIVERTGLSNKLANLLSPIIKKLFKTDNKEAQKYIAINISSNMLGLGNASTPSALKAMNALDNKTGKPTFAMIMLVVVNALAIEIIPSTTISLRAANGSISASDILLPTLIATFCSTLTGIILTIIIDKIKVRKRK